MLLEARPGAQVQLVNAVVNPMRSGLSGEVSSLGVQSRYREAVIRGNCYTGGMAAAAAMGTALTSTMVTICLYNPQASNVNLVLLNVNGVVTSVTTTAGAENARDVLAANIVQNQAAPTGTTLIAHTNCLLGGSQGKGKLFSAATLAANPTFLLGLSFLLIPAGGTNETDTRMASDVNIDGRIILPPNTSVCVQGIGSTAHSGQWNITWEEVPI